MTLIPNMQRVKMYSKHRVLSQRNLSGMLKPSIDYEFRRPVYASFYSDNVALESAISRSNPSLVVGASFGVASMALVLLIVMVLTMVGFLLRWRHKRNADAILKTELNLIDEVSLARWPGRGCYQGRSYGSFEGSVAGVVEHDDDYLRNADHFQNSGMLDGHDFHDNWAGHLTIKDVNDNTSDDVGYSKIFQPPVKWRSLEQIENCSNQDFDRRGTGSIWERLRFRVDNVSRIVDRTIKRQLFARRNSERQHLIGSPHNLHS